MPEANDYLEYYLLMQDKYNKEYLIKNRNNKELFNNNKYLYDIIINYNSFFNSLFLYKIVTDSRIKHSLN